MKFPLLSYAPSVDFSFNKTIIGYLVIALVIIVDVGFTIWSKVWFLPILAQGHSS
jgi:hypothetical protein